MSVQYAHARGYVSTGQISRGMGEMGEKLRKGARINYIRRLGRVPGHGTPSPHAYAHSPIIPTCDRSLTSSQSHTYDRNQTVLL